MSDPATTIVTLDGPYVLPPRSILVQPIAHSLGEIEQALRAERLVPFSTDRGHVWIGAAGVVAIREATPDEAQAAVSAAERYRVGPCDHAYRIGVGGVERVCSRCGSLEPRTARAKP